MNLANPSTKATTREQARPILIVGASARAAAASAGRAGLVPLAIDRFNDADLDALCEQCLPYRAASEVPRLADEFAEADWIYTGPFENHTRVLDSVASKRRLLGNDARTVKQIRNPWKLYDCLRDAGLVAPQVRCSVEELRDGLWLKKPLRSGGGCGIEACVTGRNAQRLEIDNRSVPRQASARSPHYYQQHIPGTSYSAIFAAANKQATLLGVTEQLIGTAWNAASPYQYAGSIGPLRLPLAAEKQLRRVGDSLSERFALQGLCGVDFILSEDCVWPVEVNPRYTASVEVIEIATNASLLGFHLETCRNQRLPAVAIPASSLVAGKLILYARHALTVCQSVLKEIADRSQGVIADIPRIGTQLAPGDPICTVFVTAATADDARRQLATSIQGDGRLDATRQ